MGLIMTSILGQLLDRPTRKIRGKMSEKLLDNPLTKGTYSQLKTGYESGKDRATQYARSKDIDKVGGTGGHYMGQLENMWYVAQGRGKSSGGGDDSSGDSSVEEPGTRATTSRRFDYGDTGSTRSRRSLLTGGDTNRTQGKKAKTLRRKAGGR